MSSEVSQVPRDPWLVSTSEIWEELTNKWEEFREIREMVSNIWDVANELWQEPTEPFQVPSAIWRPSTEPWVMSDESSETPNEAGQLDNCAAPLLAKPHKKRKRKRKRIIPPRMQLAANPIPPRMQLAANPIPPRMQIEDPFYDDLVEVVYFDTGFIQNIFEAVLFIMLHYAVCSQ